MKAKILIIVILILSMSNITCSKKKITYQELNEILFTKGLVNKRWFKEWNPTEKEVKEVKEIIKKIQITIASNDIKGFTEFFEYKVQIINTFHDTKVKSKKELVKDREFMRWIKRWYFGQGKEVKQSYRDYLKKVLRNEKIDAKYKMLVMKKSDGITTKKELYSYNNGTRKSIWKYFFGFDAVVSTPDKGIIGIGINNFGDGWKIVYLLVGP